MFSSLLVFLGVGLVRAGTTVWSGSFDNYATVADFDKCEWLSCFYDVVVDLCVACQGLGQTRLDSTNGCVLFESWFAR